MGTGRKYESTSVIPDGPTVGWAVGGHPGSIEFPTSLCENILAPVCWDPQPTPLGVCQVGGVLFGETSANKLRIRAFRPLPCEHPHAPSYELGVGDEEHLRRLLDGAAVDRELAGMSALGWYLTKSRWSVLAQRDREIYDRYFPAPWQVAMVLVRQHDRPSLMGFFHRNTDGSISSSRAEVWLGAPKRAADPAQMQAPATAPAQITPASPAAPPVDDQTTGALAARPQAAVPLVAGVRIPAPPGLGLDPFSRIRRSSELYRSRRGERVIAELLRNIRNRYGLMVLTGASGTGKSSLLLRLGDLLVRESIEFALLPNVATTSQRFFEMLDYDLDLHCGPPSRENVLRSLLELLLRNAEESRTTALIIDDAHGLHMDVLEEIRHLDRFENRGGKLLQVLLCGAPELDRLLESDGARELNRRVALRRRLQPLEEDETADYINRQLATAGLDAQVVFPRPILTEIHARTSGLFPLIDAVCSRLLRVCSLRSSRRATRELLNQVCMGLGLPPGSRDT